MKQTFTIQRHIYKILPSDIIEGLVKLGIDVKGMEIYEVKEGDKK